MKILIIADYIAPVSRIASIRWTKIGKYLSATCGCNVDILTNRKSYRKTLTTKENYYDRDEMLADDLRYFDHVYECPDTGLARCANAVRNVLFGLTERITAHRKNPDNGSHGGLDPRGFLEAASSRTLTERAIKSLEHGFVNLKNEAHISTVERSGVDWASYDAVISTFDPEWPHLLAERMKSEHPQVIWLADYRDPLIDSPGEPSSGDVVSVYEQSESYPPEATAWVKSRFLFASTHTKQADCILAVSKGIVGALFLDSTQQCEVVYNGYDQEEVPERFRTKNALFTIAYTGSFYVNERFSRDVTPAFRALTELIEAGQMDPDDLEIVYCGKSSDEFMRQASQYSNLPVRDLGLLSRKDTLDIQDSASLLLFSTWNTRTSPGCLTGKLYEYLSSGTPIIGICSGELSDHESSQIIRRAQAGFAYEEANDSLDHPGLVSYIKEKYDQWKRDGITSVDADWDYIETFSHAKIAEQVYDLIAQLQDDGKADSGRPNA